MLMPRLLGRLKYRKINLGHLLLKKARLLHPRFILLLSSKAIRSLSCSLR
jgi:hypothetical protein